MISKEAKNLIENNPIAISTCLNNEPNISTAAFVKVIDDDKLLITDNFMEKTIKNIIKNKKVSIIVWDEDFVGYKIIGEAEYFTEGDWVDFVKKMPENKEFLAKGAILVKVNTIKEVG